jgi:hypothetical protein
VFDVKTGIAIATAAAALFSGALIASSARAVDEDLIRVGSQAGQGQADGPAARNDCRNASTAMSRPMRKSDAAFESADATVRKG